MKGLRVVSACALAVAALVMASCQTPPTGGNTPPTASFTASPLVGLAPLPVNFDASASFDTGGSISAYEWTFGDGATATGVTTSHTFTVDGTYAVRRYPLADQFDPSAFSNLVGLTLFVVAGKVTADGVTAAAVAAPALVIGQLVGFPLRKHVHGERFRWLVLVLLIAAAISAIVSALT